MPIAQGESPTELQELIFYPYNFSLKFKLYDVKEKQSGTSVKGKPCISKRGNKYLRKAMHMPSLTAIQHCERFKAIFIRLVSKHGIKMKAAVAVQRKLLEMIYTIHKSGKKFDQDYLVQEETLLTV